MQGKLLTTAEVAQRLDVATSTVTLWCRQGLFPNAIRPGAGAIWLIPESDLTDFERPKRGYPAGRPRAVGSEGEGDDQE